MRAPFNLNLVLDWKVYTAFRSIKRALEGDMSVLIERVDSEVNLSHQERKLIAKILRGERVRPQHRIRTSETDRKHESIAKFVYARKHLTGHKQEAIVEDAVQHFGVSRATVMNVLKEKRSDPDAERRFDDITKAAVEMMTSEEVVDLPVKDVPVVIKGITFPKVDEGRTSLDPDFRLPDAAHVRLPVVAALYATSHSNVWRWVKQGLVPQPRKLGPQTTVWNVGDLRRALAGGSDAAR